MVCQTREHVRSIMETEAAKPEIIVVSLAQDYRRLAKAKVTERDAVLEIGCAHGPATRKLAERAARVLAVDVAPDIVAGTRRKLAEFDNVEVAQCDARDVDALKSLMAAPDVIFLDIGGTALLDNVAMVLRQCLLAFRPRLVVVRSFELAEVASRITQVSLPDRACLFDAEPKGRDRALQSLLELSHSVRASNRLVAARKLRRLDDPDARKRLAEMVDDPDRRIRRTATDAAG